MYAVDAAYLVGRMPEVDARVTSGGMRALGIDTSGAVSRVHAEIRVDGWDALLVDAGSRNGTFVCAPGEQGWTQLPAGEWHRLVPGTRVRLGGRSFLFESLSGAPG
jgi:pSer/pThr/pTyr-binding forkhead associated (FHA) protein